MVETGMIRPIGEVSSSRRRAGAWTLILGGGLLFLLTGLADLAPWESLVVLGGVILAAWLVDGSSRRYLGPGVAAVAVGGGISLGKAFDMEPVAAEHILVYGLLGIGFLVVSYFNLAAVRAGAAFLVLTGLSATNMTYGISFTLGWELAAVAVAYGLVELVLITRHQPGIASETAGSPDGGQGRVPVGSSAGPTSTW